MEEENKNLSDVSEMVSKYVKNQTELVELKLLRRSTKIIANLMTQTAVVLAVILAFVFGTVACGFWLSDVLNSYAMGFGWVTLLYIVIAVIVAFTKRRYLEESIMNQIIKKYVDGQEE